MRQPDFAAHEADAAADDERRDERDHAQEEQHAKIAQIKSTPQHLAPSQRRARRRAFKHDDAEGEHVPTQQNKARNEEQQETDCGHHPHKQPCENDPARELSERSTKSATESRRDAETNVGDEHSERSHAQNGHDEERDREYHRPKEVGLTRAQGLSDNHRSLKNQDGEEQDAKVARVDSERASNDASRRVHSNITQSRHTPPRRVVPPRAHAQSWRGVARYHTASTVSYFGLGRLLGLARRLLLDPHDVPDRRAKNLRAFRDSECRRVP